MKDDFPKIYKNKIEKIKSKIQNEYYYHYGDNIEKENINQREEVIVDKVELLKKIDKIFQSPNFVYQADINIMFKNGENIVKKVVGKKDNSLITMEGEMIFINDILDIK